MTKKFSLLMLVAVIFAVLLCLNSCFLIEKPDEKPEEDPPVIDPPSDDPATDEPADDEPTVDLSLLTLNDLTCVYDGKPHSITVSGDLPEGVTVGYQGNGVKDAGEYTVNARFYYNGEYLSGKDLSAKITIRRAVYDDYEIAFDGGTFIYDGKGHSVLAKGLPKGVMADYSGNGVSEIGEHTVTARFIVDNNHEPIPDKTATIRIVSGPAAYAGAYLLDRTVVYDGTEYSVKVEGSSTSYMYEAQNNVATDAGVYNVSIFMTNGTDTFTFTSVLNVKPAKIKATATDKTVTYDGGLHSIALEWDGGQPKGVNVTALGNGTAAVGEHNVRFRFSLDESVRGNYLYHPDINVTLTIERDTALETVDGLTYKAVSGGYSITGYEGEEARLVIPEYIKNSLGISAKVVEIASGAFAGNKTLEYVYMPDGVTTIGHSAFRGCTSLKSVTMSSLVRVIGALAFSETAIKDVVLPDSLQAIGQGAFRGTPVERITLPFIGGSRTTSNPYIGYIFGASAYAANETYLPSELKTVILSDKCTLVPAYSFFGATSIEEVIIGARVTEVGISAFQGCSSLIGLYIPSSVSDVPADDKNYNSPVFGCGDGFTVGTGIKDKAGKPNGWGSRWDIVSSTARATVLWDVTYEEYLEAVCEAAYFAAQPTA